MRQLVSGKGLASADRGEMEKKCFEEPVRLYEVRWEPAKSREIRSFFTSFNHMLSILR